MTAYGDPAQLDHRASELHDLAQGLRVASIRHVRMGQEAQWVSTAATVCRQRIAEDHAAILETADRLDSAAVALSDHAESVRATIAQIGRIEHAVTNWFRLQMTNVGQFIQETTDLAGNVVREVLDVPPPWETWPVTPYTLPPTGDKAWLEVGHFMRSMGVTW